MTVRCFNRVCQLSLAWNGSQHISPREHTNWLLTKLTLILGLCHRTLLGMEGWIQKELSTIRHVASDIMGWGWQVTETKTEQPSAQPALRGMPREAHVWFHCITCICFNEAEWQFLHVSNRLSGQVMLSESSKACSCLITDCWETRGVREGLGFVCWASVWALITRSCPCKSSHLRRGRRIPKWVKSNRAENFQHKGDYHLSGCRRVLQSEFLVFLSLCCSLFSC